MLNTEEMRFAIEDARTRHEACVGLIGATDQQALALLSLYVTLGLAAGSAMIGALTSPNFLPSGLTIPLFVATVTLTVGSYYCFKTIETSPINLPGREPSFWLWAARADITAAASLAAYLDNLQKKYDQNYALNMHTSRMVRRAKIAGIVAPVAAIIAWATLATLHLVHLT